MARVLWVLVMTGWVVVAVRAIRVHRRSRPDVRLAVALEALRHIRPT